LKYDKLYDDLMGMYDALAPRIDEAYGKVSVQSLEFADEPLDANGNPLFVNPSHLGGRRTCRSRQTPLRMQI